MLFDEKDKLVISSDESEENKEEETTENQEEKVEEEPVLNEPIQEEKVEEPAVEEKKEWEDFKEAIDKHFAILKNLLINMKSKDANISILSNEITKYRDGYVGPLFRSLAMTLISYREDCLKSIRDLSVRELNDEEVRKYLSFIPDDFENLLYNLKIEKEDDKWLYNRKDIENVPSTHLEAPEAKMFELPTFENREVSSMKELLVYLKDVETFVTDVLKDSSEQDKLLSSYIAQASLFEQGIHQVALYPLIRRIIALGDYIRKRIEELEQKEVLVGDDYFTFQREISEKIADLLLECDVKIMENLDEFNPKMHRVLKVTPTEDESQKGKIFARFSDGYLMGDDEKVIYPQKVGIYK